MLLVMMLLLLLRLVWVLLADLLGESREEEVVFCIKTRFPVYGGQFLCCKKVELLIKKLEWGIRRLLATGGKGDFAVYRE